MTCDRSVIFSVRPPRYNWNIVESGVKHHKPNQNLLIDHLTFSAYRSCDIQPFVYLESTISLLYNIYNLLGIRQPIIVWNVNNMSTNHNKYVVNQKLEQIYYVCYPFCFFVFCMCVVYLGFFFNKTRYLCLC